MRRPTACTPFLWLGCVVPGVWLCSILELMEGMLHCRQGLRLCIAVAMTCPLQLCGDCLSVLWERLLWWPGLRGPSQGTR